MSGLRQRVEFENEVIQTDVYYLKYINLTMLVRLKAKLSFKTDLPLLSASLKGRRGAGGGDGCILIRHIAV